MTMLLQLEHIFTNHQIALPYKGQGGGYLEKELKCLKRIFSPTGFKIQPDPEGAVTSDDLVDSLAGAVGSAMESTYTGYVKSGTVNMPQSREGDMSWKVGSASYTSQQWGSYNQKFGMPR